MHVSLLREALHIMREHEEVRSLKLKRLRRALSEGDLAAGRSTTLSSDDELAEFFARL